eukprot:5270711-Prymnesium_polylepis.1
MAETVGRAVHMWHGWGRGEGVLRWDPMSRRFAGQRNQPDSAPGCLVAFERCHAARPSAAPGLAARHQRMARAPCAHPDPRPSVWTASD